jgi:tRNA 5-methylaminomethyl-2-thiouridine biosynthesis bifunctional protein
MSHSSATPDASPVLWDAGGTPRSPRFDDVYYSSAGGLAEAGAVFLEGCGLPGAWAGRSRFVVGELGFGTGLNILALVDLWRRSGPAGGRLHIFSVEAFPMPQSDARRALAPWPELADLAAPLLARWPRRARGFHRLAFAELGVTLDLAVMDAAEALEAWSGQADAWFLDGFSPSRNPGMWSETVLAGVARRSAPGARAATFTVAGAVRRGLEANGFQVEKKPGFANKKERLEARLATAPRSPPRPAPRVAIVGTGIAGASLARAFLALGVRPVIVEASAPGAGASGNPAALVMPRLDAGDGPIGALYAQALARAADLYDQTPAAVIAGGARQLEAGPKDPGRFDRIAHSPLFETGAVERLTPADLSAQLGEPVGVGGLHFHDARVIAPAAVLDDWLQGLEVIPGTVAAVESAGEAWRLLDGEGGEITIADIVCLACGPAVVRLAPDQPVTPLRGQVSLAAVTPPPAVIGAGYAIPTRQGLLFGATHDRDESGDDHRRNRDLLAATLPNLAARLERVSLEGRASIRAVTPDFLPLAGPLGAGGLFILSGLGSRGFCAAPLLGEHVAALALGAPSPLPAGLAQIVDPGRFAARRNRRLVRSAKVQVANSI